MVWLVLVVFLAAGAAGQDVRASLTLCSFPHTTSTNTLAFDGPLPHCRHEGQKLLTTFSTTAIRGGMGDGPGVASHWSDRNPDAMAVVIQTTLLQRYATSYTYKSR
jgi:hypothetical protein